MMSNITGYAPGMHPCTNQGRTSAVTSDLFKPL